MKIYNADAIKQIPDENPVYPLVGLRTPIYNFFTTPKVEIEAAFPEYNPEITHPTSLLYAFFYHCHTGRHCLLGAVRTVYNRKENMIRLGLDHVYYDKTTRKYIGWSTPTIMMFPYEPETKVKITGTYNKSTTKYHFDVDIDGSHYESQPNNEYAKAGAMAHSNDDVDEIYMKAHHVPLGAYVVQWDAPGSYSLGTDTFSEKHEPITIYSFKAWNEDSSLATSLIPIAITDDDGSNERGGMYDELTGDVIEGETYNNAGKSKFEPINPQYPPPVYNKVNQYPYIIVYDSITQQEDFNNNGLRIIMPTRCEITEELNGTYELMLEMPIDEDGAWQSIREFNIIKACGQLFTIYRVVTKFSGNEGHLVAYAKHIFYKMADWWMPPNTIISKKYFVTDILSVFSKCRKVPIDNQNAPNYQFSGTSDITKPGKSATTVYSEITALEAIYGNDANSLINFYGGELYRDNFRFSINEKMENSNENGFHLRVGLNLTGIKRDVDYSDFCSYLTGYDGFGGYYSLSWVGTYIPNNIVRSVTFKYDPETYSFDMLIADTTAYWGQVCTPKVSFEIDKANLRDNPDYSNFSELWDTKVGDSGVIYDERLGGEIKVRVIKTKRDGRNGNVTSVVLSNNGGMWRSGTGSGVGNKVQTKQDKETQEQIKQAKIKAMGTWVSLENYKWLEMGQFTWQEANGGN